MPSPLPGELCSRPRSIKVPRRWANFVGRIAVFCQVPLMTLSLSFSAG